MKKIHPAGVEKEIIMDPEFVCDWEMTKRRYAAWWNNEIIDRPVVWLTCPREKPRWPVRDIPDRSKMDPSAHYLDPDYCVDVIENTLATTDYFGDAVPVADRGIGTAYLGSLAGGTPKFATGKSRTVWMEPFVRDWENAAEPRFDIESALFKKILAVSRALGENSRGRYTLAIPDHLDAVTTMSQMQGVEAMCLNLMDNPDPVYAYRDKLVNVWKDSFDFWMKHDKELGLDGTMNWAGAFSSIRGGVLQCDFSYIISPDMFRTLVKPELTAEGSYLDATLYHWDGPGQLPHRDILLEMPEITAIQWVPGAGRPGVAEYPDPLIDAQKSGKPIQILCCIDELDKVIKIFSPKGVMIRTGFRENQKNDPEVCRMVMRKIEKWGSRG